MVMLVGVEAPDHVVLLVLKIERHELITSSFIFALSLAQEVEHLRVDRDLRQADEDPTGYSGVGDLVVPVVPPDVGNGVASLRVGVQDFRQKFLGVGAQGLRYFELST